MFRMFLPFIVASLVVAAIAFGPPLLRKIRGPLSDAEQKKIWRRS